MNIKKLTWKIFSINRDEFSFVWPLFLIYFLSGSFFAIGQIFSETIFLKAYGASGFSGFFIQNGIALILAGILYNYFFLKLSLRRGYIYLISFFVILITSAYVLYKQEIKWMPFYIYMANYLFSVFLDIHFFNYAFQTLTIRNSKRILPFLLGGGKLGGIIAGLFTYLFFSKNISEFGMQVWAINGAAILIPIIFFNIKNLSKSGNKIKTYEALPDFNLLDKLIKYIKSVISSRFFIYAVLCIFIVSIANQITEYYFAKIFNEAFSTKNELSAFLSLYTLGADLLSLLLQIFVVSKILNNIGIRKANLIYPVSFLSLIGINFAFPNIFIGVMLRFFRKNLSTIIRAPVFNVIMSVSPRDRMAGVKSFMSGIISPLGMIAGGFAILLISERLSPAGGYAFAVLVGIVFIVFSHLQNKSYVKSLEDRIKYDSLIQDTEVGDDAEGVFNNYSDLIKDKYNTKKNLPLVEALFNNQPSLELLPVLELYFNQLNSETKENALNIIRTGKSESETGIILKAMEDKDLWIRAIALSLIKYKSKNDITSILKDRQSSAAEGEQLAKTLLLGIDKNNNEIIADDYGIEKLIEIKNSVLKGDLQPIDFAMFIQTLPYQYFLNHLYDLLIKSRDPVLFKCIIPFAENLTRRRIIKILYLFRNERLDLLTRFLMLSNAEEADKIMLLDYREIPIDYMKKIFKYDEKSGSILYARLFRNLSYFKKSNYLKYFLSREVNNNNKELVRYIDFEIEQIKNIFNLLKFAEINPAFDAGTIKIYNFLKRIIPDIADIKKHLILKAISLITGLKIDDAYESSILLHDKDLDNLILEYIESSLHNTKEIIYFFDKKQFSDYKPDKKQFSPNSILSKEYKYLENFLPELSGLLKFCFNTIEKGQSILIQNKSNIEHLKHKEHDMLSHIEKIIFLKDNKLFSELKINEIINIAKIANEIEVPAGKSIIKQGENGDTLFIILSGEVRVSSRGKNIAVLGTGNCIGELSIIDEEPRSADVVTTQKVKLLSVSRKEFLLTLIENPSISIKVMQVIAERLRKLL